MSSNMSMVPKATAYKRYLTSIWHTRWLHAAFVSLLWHLSVSAASDGWYTSISSFFWAFFPLGPAGFRAALFWVTSLIIFMVPLSTFKVGQRCTPSNWITIKTLISNPLSLASIFIWYSISGFWFCQVFAYLSPPSQELAWVTSGGYGSPDRLNERPIYLFAFFQVLGFVHALWHVYQDRSTISLGTAITDKRGTKSEEQTTIAQLRDRAPSMARDAAMLSGVSTFITAILYSALFRRPLWRFTVTFAKAFANVARSDAMPPNSFYIGGIIVKGIYIGFLLSMTWQLDLLLFELFMVTEPVRNALPLSASSKDPNGTLLNGLTRKSDLIRTFAFWELFIISESHPLRRKDIFADIERLDTEPMLTLMVNAAIAVVNSIEDRTTALDPTRGPSTQKGAFSTANGNVQRLPRLLPSAVPAQSSILVASNPSASNNGLDRMGNYISHEAQVLGSSSSPWSPPLQKGKQLAFEYSSPAIKDLRARAETVQQSPIGRYLLASPIRMIKSIVLGTPTGNATLTLHAVNSVKNLLVASLTEDTYGRAVACVPPMIQAVTKAIFVIEHVIAKYTNGVLTQSDQQELEEVLTVQRDMKSCLKELLEKFGMYLHDVGLSIRDLNEARKAVADRQLYETLQPSQANQQSQQQSVRPRREMEEVNQQSRRPSNRKADVRSRKQDSVAQERQSEEMQRDKPANIDRRGRLFSQLDQGSAFEKAWREKRRSKEKD